MPPPVLTPRDVSVKNEPTEHATSSGCGSDEEDADLRSGRAPAPKRRGEGGGAGGGKRSRLLALEDSPPPGEDDDDRERTVRGFVEAAVGEGPEDAARFAETLRSELNMLRALAEAKEREWNQVRI